MLTLLRIVVFVTSSIAWLGLRASAFVSAWLFKAGLIDIGVEKLYLMFLGGKLDESSLRRMLRPHQDTKFIALHGDVMEAMATTFEDCGQTISNRVFFYLTDPARDGLQLIRRIRLLDGIVGRWVADSIE